MEAESPKKKKLPFKPTALRKHSSQKHATPKDGKDDKDDGLAFFKRSAQFVEQLTADAERRARKQAEKEVRQRRSVTTEKRDHSAAESGDEEESSSQKKPRIEVESEDDMYDCTPPAKKLETPTSLRYGDPATKIPENLLETPSRTKQLPAPSSARRLRNRAIINDDDDDDEEPELIPQARAMSNGHDDVPSWQARTTLAANEDGSIQTGVRSVSPSWPANVIDIEDDDDDDLIMRTEEQDPLLREYIEKARERKLAQQNEEKMNDRVMVVQVSSRLLDTTSDGKLPVFRQGPDGPLKKIKTVWCAMARNKGVEVDDKDIFLTWRDNRLYNTTTLESLGIRFMGSKKLYAGDMADSSGFTEDRKRVELEAWTEELYQTYQEELEQERLRELGEHEEVKEPTPRAAQEERIKVTVRGKQGDPVKVQIAASGTVGDLVEKYRAKRNIPHDVSVVIEFDGERLPNGLSLQDADIGDDDQVEVRLG